MKILYKWLILGLSMGQSFSPTLASETEGLRQRVESDDQQRSNTSGISDKPVPYDPYNDMAIGVPLEVESPPPSGRTHHVGVGAQALIASNPYRGGDTVILPLPMLTYVGDRFFVVSPRAGYQLIRFPSGSLNLVADYRLNGEAFEDSGYLAGMNERKNTAMAGLDTHVRLSPRWRLELSAMTDVLDRHNGQEGTIVLSRIFRQGKLSLIPGAGLVWRSANFNDYYYGVSSSEATIDRPAYDPGSNLEWFARLVMRYNLTANWSLAGAARLEALSSELRNSPIVEEDYILTTIVGLNYQF